MKELDLAEAERNFFALIDEVENGASVLIKRNGRPAAKLEPLPAKSVKSDVERRE